MKNLASIHDPLTTQHVEVQSIALAMDLMVGRHAFSAVRSSMTRPDGSWLYHVEQICSLPHLSFHDVSILEGFARNLLYRLGQ